MITPLLSNEAVLLEKAANYIGAAFSSGGKLILTNQRILYESSILGANPKLELELPLSKITGYRKSYTMMLATGVLATPNAISIITDADTYKFTIGDRDNLFSHFASAIPHAEHLPNEKYVESVKGMGGKVVSKFKGKNANTQSQQFASTPKIQNNLSMLCPYCSAENLKTAKFCNSCGEKLQLECPNCHAPIEDGIKFCSECGTPIKRKNECQNCGSKIVKGQKFCNECGERIGE